MDMTLSERLQDLDTKVAAATAAKRTFEEAQDAQRAAGIRYQAAVNDARAAFDMATADVRKAQDEIKSQIDGAIGSNSDPRVRT